MAIILVAVLLALVLMRSVPQPSRWRNFSWFEHWQRQTQAQADAYLGVILSVGVPVLVCSLVQFALRGVLFGTVSAALATGVLFYCWGPRDLESDVEAIDKAPDSERRLAAVQALRVEGTQMPLAFEPEPLAQAVFSAGLRRWFGVLFWFVLLGPAGALLYRLLHLLAFTPTDENGAAAARAGVALRASVILEWVPSRLIAVALALVSNFDAVLKTWRDRVRIVGKGHFCLDPEFLDAIARASVDADVEADVAAGDGDAQTAHTPLVALDDAMVLMRRVLIAWLTVIALIVLAGWFA
jgi:AmpE protein